jgi:hypothetical protein
MLPAEAEDDAGRDSRIALGEAVKSSPPVVSLYYAQGESVSRLHVEPAAYRPHEASAVIRELEDGFLYEYCTACFVL